MSVDDEEFQPSMAVRALAWPMPNDQQGSILYSKIPAEIRMLIFEFVFTPLATSAPPHELCVRYDHKLAEDEPVVPPFDVTEDVAQPSWFIPGSAERLMTVWQNEEMGLRTTDPCPRPNASIEWLRPELRGRKHTSYALLRTCRRLYLEAADLPALTKTLTFSYGHPASPPGTTDLLPDALLRRIPYRAAAHLRSLHFYGPQSFFERSVLHIGGRPNPRDPRINAHHPLVAHPFSPIRPETHQAAIALNLHAVRLLENLTHLRFTIRSTDWHGHEHNSPPCFHAHMVQAGFYFPPLFASGPGMTCRACERDRDAVPEDQPHVWGAVLARMPALKRFIVDFETTEGFTKVMERIVAWAMTWRFRLGPYPGLKTGSRGVLTTDVPGGGVQRMSWRGLPNHWPHTCWSCGMGAAEGEEWPRRCDCCAETAGVGHLLGCFDCRKRRLLLAEGKGPRMFVWTVTWGLGFASDEEGRDRGSSVDSDDGGVKGHKVPWFNARRMVEEGTTYEEAIERDRIQQALGAYLPYWGSGP